MFGTGAAERNVNHACSIAIFIDERSAVAGKDHLESDLVPTSLCLQPQRMGARFFW